MSDIAGDTLLTVSLARRRDLDPESLPRVNGTPQQDLRLGACVGDIGKFVCFGLNHADHLQQVDLCCLRSE